jgi:class 3 adenylate cyclase
MDLEQHERPDLFDAVVEQLLRRHYPAAEILRNAVVPNISAGSEPTTVDFLVRRTDAGAIVVDTRTPYVEEHTKEIVAGLRHLQAMFEQKRQREPVAEALLILSVPLSSRAASAARVTTEWFEKLGAHLTLWDLERVATEIELVTGRRYAMLYAAELTEALAAMRASGAAAAPAQEVNTAGEHLPEGHFANVIVLCADFCSYSLYVKESKNDFDLISNIMRRFYRQTREIIERHGGKVDKYMGDGVLCYWIEEHTEDLQRRIESCVRELTGTSIHLAHDWQKRIDHPVPMKGLRVGAAMGEILFIAETSSGVRTVHALGEPINVASRLQSEATPNTLVISNRLRNALFAERPFTELAAVELKNIGAVIPWRTDATGTDPH